MSTLRAVQWSKQTEDALSKWHLTRTGHMTLCGIPLVIGCIDGSRPEMGGVHLSKCSLCRTVKNQIAAAEARQAEKLAKADAKQEEAKPVTPKVEGFPAQPPQEDLKPRHPQRRDITGQKFGRLTAIERTTRRTSSSNYYWRCLCDCGNETEVVNSNLRNGTVRSCGCLKTEVNHARFGQKTPKTITREEWERLYGE